MPWYAKALAGFAAAYLLCPIDLIPDFIPVIGYADDLLLVLLCLLLVEKLVPPEVIAELRREAAIRFAATKPGGRLTGIVIVAVWVALGTALGWYLLT